MKNANDDGWSWQTISSNNTSGLGGITVYNETDQSSARVGDEDGIRHLIFKGDNINASVLNQDNTKVEVAVDNVTVTEVSYTGSANITVNSGNQIQVPDTSNAYGKRWIQSSAPSSADGNAGDIWYDISGDLISLNISSLPSLP